MENIVEDIDVDPNDHAQVTAKENAIDEADELENYAYLLLVLGAGSGIASVMLGRQARGKEDQIDSMEDSLLRTVERIDIYPKADGFRIMYTHKF